MMISISNRRRSSLVGVLILLAYSMLIPITIQNAPLVRKTPKDTLDMYRHLPL